MLKTNVTCESAVLAPKAASEIQLALLMKGPSKRFPTQGEPVRALATQSIVQLGRGDVVLFTDKDSSLTKSNLTL